jgi:hemolysin III
MTNVLLTPEAAPGERPSLRGWLHLWSFYASLVGAATLIPVAAAVADLSGWGVASVVVYSVTLIGLFGTSSLFHRHTWTSTRSYVWMKRLDHSMIFLFIAGTYTPFAVLSMPSSTGRVVLAVVWGGALAGVALKMIWPRAPRWVGTPVYIALGWVAVFVLPDILRGAGVAALVLLAVGGAFYTAGAVLYATRWPDPWPGVFGHHEFFHAATVLAAICHHIAIWLALFPG